jgi:hypothetical protein
MLKPADSVSITFRISSLKSNFSTRRESDGNKKYRTGFDRSNDTEQVSNSRKSLHVRCLWRISKESVVTKRVAHGELSSEFELWRPKELTPGIERSTAGRFSFLGRKSQGFASFSRPGPTTRCALCSKKDFWSASATFKVALESAENRSRTL